VVLLLLPLPLAMIDGLFDHGGCGGGSGGSGGPAAAVAVAVVAMDDDWRQSGQQQKRKWSHDSMQ
jgi:hypothetical protein